MVRQPFVGPARREHAAHGPLISSVLGADVPLAGLAFILRLSRGLESPDFLTSQSAKGDFGGDSAWALLLFPINFHSYTATQPQMTVHACACWYLPKEATSSFHKPRARWCR